MKVEPIPPTALPSPHRLVATLALVAGLAGWSPSALALPPGCTEAVGFGCSPMVSSVDAPPPPPEPDLSVTPFAQPRDTTPGMTPPAHAAPSWPAKLGTLIPQTVHRAIDWATDVGKQLRHSLGIGLSTGPTPEAAEPLPGPRIDSAPDSGTASLTAHWMPPPLMPWRQPSVAAGKTLGPSLLDGPSASAPAAPGAGVVFSMGDARPEPVATQRSADWLSTTPTLQQQRRRLQLERQRIQDSAQFNLGLRLTF